MGEERQLSDYNLVQKLAKPIIVNAKKLTNFATVDVTRVAIVA